MLHIVNGDVVANKLKQLQLPGDILVWREMLIDGPLSSHLLDEEFLQKRGAYFEQTMGVPSALFVGGIQDQMRQLREFRTHDQVILWFEHDLFDQTILLFLLDWFSRQEVGTTQISLISIGEFPGVTDFRGMGQLSPLQLATLVGTEVEVTKEQFELGSRAWQAFASTDPRAVEQLLQADTSLLPFLRDALLCHLRRLPAWQNGISQLEHHVLSSIAQGVDGLASLFDAVSSNEPVYGFGDLQLWSYLERMRTGDYPLLSITGPASLPRYDTPYPLDFTQWHLELTPTSREVLAGHSDWISKNGADRWIGGYHLTGRSPVYYWDESAKRVISK